MTTLYHLTPASFYESLDPQADFLPEAYEADGFIHCSAGKDQMLEVANRYYKAQPGDFFLLEIDEQAVRPEVRYEDAAPVPDGKLYPHIYGPLNRDAIRVVHRLPREADGTFQWYPT